MNKAKIIIDQYDESEFQIIHIGKRIAKEVRAIKYYENQLIEYKAQLEANRLQLDKDRIDVKNHETYIAKYAARIDRIRKIDKEQDLIKKQISEIK